MSGSGMVLGTAAKRGLKAIGYDLDPLACLISKVNGTQVDEARVRSACEQMVTMAKKLPSRTVTLPWIDDCDETGAYIDYWFAPKQKEQLRKLAFVMLQERILSNDAIVSTLKVSISRLIVTKEPKASRARDTAHSRPHRTITENEFDLFEALPGSLDHVLKALSPGEIQRDVSAYRGDARRMGRIRSGSVDRIVTSPPYLNAIDYMRGHRLSLIWLGYSIAKLRRLRSRFVGAEIMRPRRGNKEAREFFENLHPGIGDGKKNMLRRYYGDLRLILREAYRVLAPGRQATYVVGNSRVKGHEVRNSDLLKLAAEQSGFRIVDHFTREIPERRRYMPLLRSEETNLFGRMKTEHIMTFSK